jgi:formiminoglutamase
MTVWKGRVDTEDGPRALRWHQMVKPLTPNSSPGIVLIGFACDEGIRRNGGRVGAKDAPRTIRSALANLAWHQDRPVYDTGDVRCDDEDMEGAQDTLAETVTRVLAAGHRPLIIGGGHEAAWGTFQGIVAAKPKAKIGVINIDAHLDLRANEPGNSGTAFYQIARWCKGNERPFRYLCLGASMSANTAALFDRAQELGAWFVPDFAFIPREQDVAFKHIRKFAHALDIIHLSIDLDVLPAATMPAVSAPAGSGVPLGWVEALIQLVLQSGKTAAIDIAELNPSLDTNNNAARVAGHLAWSTSLWWAKSWTPQPQGKS